MANRLIHESSPYLLQHAENPVDWYPWGKEAIERARELDRPIFLSIGYSACHWCHVMEHESFESEAIAELMNAYFVCIKVDREERPDLDQIYMNSVQLMTGQGGWPMSVFLTPELQPFYGGTYIPPAPRFNSPGFPHVLKQVHAAWTSRRDEILAGAEEVTARIREMAGARAGSSELSEATLANAQQELLQAADRRHGGFGGAPKFPHAMDIRVLLRCSKRFADDDSLDVAVTALGKMAAGGIYDHLGGGFHRYSTDERWLVPHFEKMLYDNALLVPAYLEAYQITGREDFACVVRETLDYVLREMTQPEGGFYSTQDADSESVEGKFFVWSQQEVVDVLGKARARIFCTCYDVSARGNWEGSTILNRPRTLTECAQKLKGALEELVQTLGECRRLLFEVRGRRVAPSRDDKVLVAWNGMMISAMAQAAPILGETKYRDAAADAARFILGEMRDERGRLLHSFKDGKARFGAYLDDYACLIDGLVELYQTTFDPQWLQHAVELAETMQERFADPQGGFFYTPDDHEQLIARNRDSQDSSTPSGNAVAATALAKLGRLTSRNEFVERATQTLESFSEQIARFPMASGQALLALEFLHGPAYEFVLVEGGEAAENDAATSALFDRFLPNKVVVRGADSGDGPPSVLLKPLLQHRTSVDRQPTLYVCQDGTCREPWVGIETIRTGVGELA